jgi:hypothetical protein
MTTPRSMGVLAFLREAVPAGRIVEEGAPTDLMREGRFAALVELEAVGRQTET